MSENEERPGWERREGYWVKIHDKARHNHKLHFFCPHCKRPTGTIDDQKLLDYGFCKLCYVNHVEDRITPTIDLEYYRENFAAKKK